LDPPKIADLNLVIHSIWKQYEYALMIVSVN